MLLCVCYYEQKKHGCWWINSRLSHKEGKGEKREAGIRETGRGKKRKFQVEVKAPLSEGKPGAGSPQPLQPPSPALLFWGAQGRGSLGLQRGKRASFIALAVPACMQVRQAASESELQPLNSVLLLTPLISPDHSGRNSNWQSGKGGGRGPPGWKKSAHFPPSIRWFHFF